MYHKSATKRAAAFTFDQWFLLRWLYKEFHAALQRFLIAKKKDVSWAVSEARESHSLMNRSRHLCSQTKPGITQSSSVGVFRLLWSTGALDMKGSEESHCVCVSEVSPRSNMEYVKALKNLLWFLSTPPPSHPSSSLRPSTTWSPALLC